MGNFIEKDVNNIGEVKNSPKRNKFEPLYKFNSHKTRT